MNWLNHFFAAFSILYLLFYPTTEASTIIIFSLMFGVLIDLDFIFRRFVLKSKGKDLRTFVQEPFGLLLIALPLGLILSLFDKDYLYLTMIPYAVHIGLDYLSVHNVFPLSPFSKRKVKVGFIKPVNMFSLRELVNFRELNENYVLVINLVAFAWLVF